MAKEYHCTFCGSIISSTGVDIYKEEEYYVCQDCAVDYTFLKGYELIQVSKYANEEH